MVRSSCGEFLRILDEKTISNDHGHHLPVRILPSNVILLLVDFKRLKFERGQKHSKCSRGHCA